MEKHNKLQQKKIDFAEEILNFVSSQVVRDAELEFCGVALQKIGVTFYMDRQSLISHHLF